MKTSNDFEKIAKKNKRQRLVKTILLSTITALIVFLGLNFGLSKLTAKNGQAIEERYLTLSEIAFPNVSYHNWGYKATSQYSGIFYSDRTKDLDGIQVPYEVEEESYSLSIKGVHDRKIDLYAGDDKQSSYTSGSSLKSPMFYNRNYDYQSSEYHMALTYDIQLLAKMPNKTVEVAVTFDKDYTYDDIVKLIPNNLKINWFWIGSSSRYDTAQLYPNAQIGFSAGKSTEGEFSSAFKHFQVQAEKALKNGYLNMTVGSGKNLQFNLSSDIKNYLKDNTDASKAKFSGIILTGRSENFAQLQDKKWVYASNLGQSIDIQAYNVLDK